MFIDFYLKKQRFYKLAINYIIRNCSSTLSEYISKHTESLHTKCMLHKPPRGDTLRKKRWECVARFPKPI